MSLVDFAGGLLIPAPLTIGLSPTSFRSILLDASGEIASAVFQVPKTGNIAKIGFRTGAITQMTNSFKVGLQTVDATTGMPTGTAYGSMVAGTGAPTADTFTWYALGTDASATVGDYVSMVVEFDSFAASDSLTVNIGHTRDSSTPHFPYVTAKLGGTWTDQSYPPNFAIEYDDGSIEEIAGVTPFSGAGEVSYDSATNPDRRGLRFQVPFNCRMSGFWFYGRTDADFEVLLYDTDGTTELGTISKDADIAHSSTEKQEYYLATKCVIAKDTNYRLVLHPTTATNVRLPYFDVTDDSTNKTMDAVAMGDKFHLTTCNGAPTVEGDWTNTITNRPHMGIIVDQLDDGLGANATLAIGL